MKFLKPEPNIFTLSPENTKFENYNLNSMSKVQNCFEKNFKSLNKNFKLEK